MKILHIGMGNMPAIARELSKLGPYRFIDWTIHMELGPASKQLLEREITKVSNEMQPDFTFLHIQRPGVIDAAFASTLKGVVINYTYDVALPIPIWYEEVGRNIDLTIFCDETGVWNFTSKDIPAEFLMPGYDNLQFKASGSRGDYGDIVFLGNNYDSTQGFDLTTLRYDMVKFLKEKYNDPLGVQFKLYGNNWGGIADGNLMYKEDKEAECYRSCKIAINASHFDLERYTSDRLFRIMGCGAFCLTKWYPGIENDFTDGVHLRVWKDLQELKTLIDYYIEHVDERNEIAVNGYNLANGTSTWTHRTKQILEMAKGRVSKEYKSRVVRVAQQVYLKDSEQTPQNAPIEIGRPNTPSPPFNTSVPTPTPIIPQNISYTYQERLVTDSVGLRVLYTSFYNDKNPVRQNELSTCMQNNIQNEFIDKIYVVIEEPIENFPILFNEKVVAIPSDKRPTYQFFFDLINSNCTGNDISIIANTDIYFDESIKGFDVINFTNACLALSRWDLLSNGSIKFYDHKDSQDTWIFKGKVRPIEYADFNLGKRGCDNRIAYELNKAGYAVYNPSRTIRTIHSHNSNVRNYPAPGIDDVQPPYLVLEPTDLSVVPKIAKKKEFTILHVGFDVPPLKLAMAKLGKYYFLNWPQVKENSDVYELRKQIIAASVNMNTDLVFFQIQSHDIIDINTVKQLKGFVINWTGDVRSPIPKWYFDIGRHINLTAYSNETDVKITTNAGIPAAYLQTGFDDVIFNPEGAKNEAHEIVFLGNNYTGTFPLSNLRAKMVQFLVNNFGERFKMFGGNWNYPNAGNLMGNEQGEAAVYRGCKIAINVSHFDYERYSSDRIFRIMGSGAFCLTKWYPGIEIDFKDGVHLKVWKDFEELKKLINYYLIHEEERKQIAAAGCQYVRTYCTWDQRMLELKQLITV